MGWGATRRAALRIMKTADKYVFLPSLFLAATAGLLLWLVAAEFGGRREAWDSPLYWSLAYPLALVVCGLLGYAFPARPALWAFVLFEAQFLGMCLRAGELGGLWPLGMAAFALLALPGVALGKVGARWGRGKE
jgi:hypothetical protein